MILDRISKVFDGLFRAIDGMFQLLEAALILAAALGGGYLAWLVLGGAEVGLLVQAAGTLGAAVAAALAAWIVWTVMKLLS